MAVTNNDNCQQIKRLEQVNDERDKRYQVEFRSLRELLNANKDAVGVAIAAADKAVTKSEDANNERHKAGNEIRQAMLDREHSFAKEAETRLRFENLEKRIDDLSDYRQRTSGRGSAFSDVWVWALMAAGAGAAMAKLFL